MPDHPYSFTSKKEWNEYKLCFNNIKVGDEVITGLGGRFIIVLVNKPSLLSGYGYSELNYIRGINIYVSKTYLNEIILSYPLLTRIVKIIKKKNPSVPAQPTKLPLPDKSSFRSLFEFMCRNKF